MKSNGCQSKTDSDRLGKELSSGRDKTGRTVDIESNASRLLNLGCGAHYHSAWVNVDFSTTSSDVLEHDLRKPLPFDDASFDVVYSAHALEHFCQSDALAVLQECKRVLRPNGILRLVVPDLENACRSYLAELENAREHQEDIPRLEWSVVELIDQIGRRYSGGEMRRMICSPHPAAKDFIVERIGKLEFSNLSGHPANANENRVRGLPETGTLLPAARRLPRAMRNVMKRMCKVSALLLLQISEGAAMKEAIATGLFLLRGENHRWMYDDVQLGQLMMRAGFSNPVWQSYSHSLVEDFQKYALDEVEGEERKPNSLYMEAVA